MRIVMGMIILGGGMLCAQQTSQRRQARRQWRNRKLPRGARKRPASPKCTR